MPCVLSIVGKKGLGKSSVLESLITLLTQKGFRVGVIKYLARDDFEIDQPGKDTFRYREQGASKVILSGRKRLALFSNIEKETPVEDLLSHFLDYDIVFLEGYLLKEIPRIEIQQAMGGDEILRLANSIEEQWLVKESEVL